MRQSSRASAPTIAAVIYNRLHLRMPLGIDAALRYALHIPRTESILESQLHNPTPYNLRLHTGLPPTPIDNPGLASIQAAAHPAKVDYLYFVAKPDKATTSSRRARPRSSSTCARTATAASVAHVALLGHPVAQSLSPRMQNAAFAARGLDWRYDAFDVDDVVAAVAALRTLGFAGANVTIPYKEDVVAACDEADGDAVNTLVFRDGRVLGFNTDREILAGIDATRACVIGGGGAAQGACAGAPRRHARVHAQRRLAAGRDRLRPDRQRDAGPRRAARPAGRRTDGRRPRLRARRRRRSSSRRAPRAASSSTGARRSCGRAPRASRSGRASSRPSRRCAAAVRT